MCSAPGCSNRPTGFKPFCSDHLEQLPYVRGLLASIESGLQEDEILAMLDASGALTIPRLALRLDVPERTLRRSLAGLKARGRVEVRVLGPRKQTFVILPGREAI